MTGLLAGSGRPTAGLRSRTLADSLTGPAAPACADQAPASGPRGTSALAPASPVSRANRSASVSRRRTTRSTPPAHGHHRRAGDHVVVRRHRPAVGAGRRDRQQVTALQVGGQPRVADHDVAGLAVLAHDPGQHRRGGRGPRGQDDGVVGVVEGRADVVAHPAVDRHVRAPGARAVLDGLDRAHLVDGDHARTDDGPTGLHGDHAARRSPAGRTPPRRCSRSASAIPTGATGSSVGR